MKCTSTYFHCSLILLQIPAQWHISTSGNSFVPVDYFMLAFLCFRRIVCSNLGCLLPSATSISGSCVILWEHTVHYVNSYVFVPQRAQRRALDMVNTLGLSDSLLRVIERRQKGDVWLTYGGMVCYNLHKLLRILEKWMLSFMS